MVMLLHDNETSDSDVAFDIEGQIIYEHKCIIKAHAQDLQLSNPMPQRHEGRDISNDAHILPNEWMEHSESFIGAAKKYELNKDLKLHLYQCMPRIRKSSLEYPVLTRCKEFSHFAARRCQA
jgi:hypothetical protein